MKQYLLILLFLVSLTDVHAQARIKKYGKPPIRMGNGSDTTDREVQYKTNGGFVLVQPGKADIEPHPTILTSAASFSTATAQRVIAPDGGVCLKRVGTIPSVCQNALYFQGPTGTYYERDWYADGIKGRWFGLVSDTTFNATTILQKIASEAPHGSTVVIPSGILQTAAITVSKNIQFVSEEADALWKISGTFSPAISFTDRSNVGISGFHFYKSANTTSTTIAFFRGCTNVEFERNRVRNALQGVVFVGSNYVYVRENRIENMYNSGIRCAKDSLTAGNARTCNYVYIEQNTLFRCVTSIGQTGHGAIFIGADGATAAHTNINIRGNQALDQLKMCVAADGKVIGLTITDNRLIQGADAVSGEVMALGGGTNIDGMKKVIVSNNYFEQPSTKSTAASLVVYSNVTDLTITGNRFKYGPQGIFFHFPFSYSLIGDVTVTNNNFNNCAQGILFLKESGVTLTAAPYKILMDKNYFWDCAQVLQYGSLSTSDATFVMGEHHVDGKLVKRANNDASIYAQTKENWVGYYDHTSTVDEEISAGLYTVGNTSVTGATTVYFGATSNRLLPRQRFAGTAAIFSGTNYGLAEYGIFASNNTNMKEVARFRLSGAGFVPVLRLNGTYNDQIIQLRNSYLWSDASNNLRVKVSSLPGSDTDGDILLKNTTLSTDQTVSGNWTFSAAPLIKTSTGAGMKFSGSGSDGIGYIWNPAASPTGFDLRIGAKVQADSTVSIRYTPGTAGAGNGVMDIGQVAKANTNWTHGITNFYTAGTVKMSLNSTGQLSLSTAPTSTTSTNPALLVRNTTTGFFEQILASALPVSASAVTGTLAIAQLPYSSTTSLGTSNTVVPTQGAVKSYVDNAVAGVATTVTNADYKINGIALSSCGLLNAESTKSLTSGTGYSYRVTAPVSATVTKVAIEVTTAAGTLSGGSSGNNIAIFNSSGTQLGWADCSTGGAFTATGVKTVNLASSVTLTAGTEYIIVVVCTASTPLSLTSTNPLSSINAGISAAPYRHQSKTSFSVANGGTITPTTGWNATVSQITFIGFVL